MRTYVYASYIDEPVMMIDSQEDYHYYHQNSLYNVVALVGEFGIERYSYTAYGKPTFHNTDGTVKQDQVSSSANPYLYTGRRYDPETGLYYYRARYYDADLGRFIGRDPIGFAAGSMSLYEYVGGQATRFVDPYGLRSVTSGAYHWSTIYVNIIGYGWDKGLAMAWFLIVETKKFHVASATLNNCENREQARLNLSATAQVGIDRTVSLGKAFTTSAGAELGYGHIKVKATASETTEAGISTTESSSKTTTASGSTTVAPCACIIGDIYQTAIETHYKANYRWWYHVVELFTDIHEEGTGIDEIWQYQWKSNWEIKFTPGKCTDDHKCERVSDPLYPSPSGPTGDSMP